MAIQSLMNGTGRGVHSQSANPVASKGKMIVELDIIFKKKIDHYQARYYLRNSQSG
jgi:hypothetical protein